MHSRLIVQTSLGTIIQPLEAVSFKISMVRFFPTFKTPKVKKWWIYGHQDNR